MRGFYFMEKFKAFTLAEVLITLAVLGVVAAMTIPTLVNNSSDQSTVTKVKKYQLLKFVKVLQMLNDVLLHQLIAAKALS